MMCSDFDLIHVAVRKETETHAVHMMARVHEEGLLYPFG